MDYIDDKEFTQDNEENNEEIENAEEVIEEDDNVGLIEEEENLIEAVIEEDEETEIICSEEEPCLDEICEEVVVSEENDVLFDSDDVDQDEPEDLFTEPERPKKKKSAGAFILVGLVAIVLLAFGYFVITRGGAAGIPDVDSELYKQGMAFVGLVRGDKLLDTDFITGAKPPSEILSAQDYKAYEEFTATLNDLDFDSSNENTQVFINMVMIVFNTRMNQGVFQYFHSVADVNPQLEGVDTSQLLNIASVYGEIADDAIALIETKNVDNMKTYIETGEFSSKLAPYEDFLTELSAHMDVEEY